MVVHKKRVFYMKYLMDPVYAAILAQRPDILLDNVEGVTEESERAILAAAQVYQISSARGEISPDFYADQPLLSRAPNLLVVSTNGVGYDTVNLKACTEAGVLVVNPAGGNRESVAEHVLAMILCLSKRLIQVDRFMRRESDFDRESFMGNEIFGKTIGVVGIGHIGSRVAELCRGLFAMRVLACDPYLTEAQIAARGAEKVELADLLRLADFVSLHCPLTDETRGMIGSREYAMMRPTAYFFNTARGFIHDEAALAEALGEKRIAGAGLDVWTKEPPPQDHPLLKFDNVLVSPHTAGVTREARINIARVAAEQVLDILDGRKPRHILNREAWPAYRRRFEQAFGCAPQEEAARTPAG